MTQIFAFAKIDDEAARQKVFAEIKNGKSRFGVWDQKCSLRDEYYGANAFLLRIQKGDWIVHVNNPEYGRCTAVQVTGEYQFDDGIPVESGRDFNNYIPVNPESVVEFDRNDPNVLPSVNLAPRKRGQRILAVEDFIQSLDNLSQKRHTEYDEGIKGLAHIKSKMTSVIFPQITQIIQQMNRGKEFENFLHKIFSSMPNVLSIQNGFGWRSDQGADLIVEFQNPIVGVNLTTRLIIQAKSFEGSHYDLNAVDQIKQGIAKFKADGGLLITTAESTEELEDKARKTSEEIGKTIDVLAGADVAKFVLTHAHQLLIGTAK
jgi:hypothetical protein